MYGLNAGILIPLGVSLLVGIGLSLVIVMIFLPKFKYLAPKDKVTILRKILGEDSKYQFEKKPLNWIFGWSPNFPPKALALIILTAIILLLIVFVIDKFF